MMHYVTIWSLLSLGQASFHKRSLRLEAETNAKQSMRYLRLLWSLPCIFVKLALHIRQYECRACSRQYTILDLDDSHGPFFPKF